ncbi:MAG: hypothetical protein GQ565_13715 [Candidatus Aegiribacteria sp.]|nr:hypothetical protein [Candidatus Aegiribacteria sp.]
METIQLLKPEHESCTKKLQAFQWPAKSKAAPGSSEQTESTDDSFQWDALNVLSDDRSIPRPVCFAWEGIPAVSENPVYDLLISTDGEFKYPRVIEDIPEPCCNVLNLYINTRYFWKVIARNHSLVFAVSPMWTFTTHASTPRWLHIPCITNIRDMGGWRLRGNQHIQQGLIYRSSEMNGHVDITDKGRQVLIDELRIRTDVDLRGSSEEPKAVLDQSVVKWINIPIRPYGYIVEDACSEGYRQIFKVFSEPSNYPILFHCWGGCDRSGTVAFLLHALLGLDRNALIRDYELSSLTIWGERSHLSNEFQSLLCALLPFGDRKDDVGKQVESYLRSIGVTTEEIASIRTHLTAETDDR